MNDLISRQAAIDALSRGAGCGNICRRALEHLPTVQVEPLTDREQRIFLAAMSREKEVCKEVDYQLSDVREPYEDTLVSVCKEIERKVKAALWTN
jgi:hypothetical protein